MTLPMPGAGGRGLQFRLLGFPVRIDLTFVIVLGFLGLGVQPTIPKLAIWIGIGAASVLAHELGHALVARTTGAHPTIDLYGFGGVTQYQPPGPLSRARQLAISIAGPLVGITVGLVLWRLVDPPYDPYGGSLLAYARNAAIFVNLGWGVLNLLPVLPLDGGTVLAELLPGDAGVRRRRAAWVSVVTGAAIAVFALTRGYYFGAFFAGWLAFDNLRLVRPRPQPAPGSAPVDTGDAETNRSALWLVDTGALKEARHLVDSAERPADQAVHGLVLALTGQPGVGRRLLESAVAAAPGDPTRIGAYSRMLLHDGDWGQLIALMSGPTAPLVPPAVASTVREAVVDKACEVARSGDTEGALGILSRAVDLGWRDAARAESDSDLATVRALPGYAELRVRMAAAG